MTNESGPLGKALYEFTPDGATNRAGAAGTLAWDL